MRGGHTKVVFRPATKLEDAVNTLINHRAKGELVCGEFNGVYLYSDTVTMDGAFKSVTGMTKSEFDELLKEKTGRNKKAGTK